MIAQDNISTNNDNENLHFKSIEFQNKPMKISRSLLITANMESVFLIHDEFNRIITVQRILRSILYHNPTYNLFIGIDL